MTSAGPDPAALAAPLLRWYERAGRSLPWRGIDDLYRIWVSEIMLQQTRVDTVLGFYERFCERFATVQSLAEASSEEVMAAWSGLGFYRRARNLHAGARTVVAEHGGLVPEDPEVLGRLPGIGRYTTGAILSSGRNARLPILDGNVIRVLTRVYSIGQPSDRAATKRQLWGLAEAVLPNDRPGDFNQALMDLGATVCTPAGPRCDACPLAGSCSARADGAAEDFPHPTRATKVRFEERIAVLLTRPDGRFLIRRRPDRGLLSSMWELPSRTLAPDEAPLQGATDLARDVPGASSTVPLSEAGTVEHRFSHRHWTVHVFTGPVRFEEAATFRDGEDPNSRWVLARQLDDLGVPTVSRKTIRAGLEVSPGA